MKALSLLLAAAVALPALAAPAAAQSRAEQARWQAAQRRYDDETRLYQRERDAYFAARERDRRLSQDIDDRRFETSYDAARDYRDDARYQERVLGANDQVYRGSDGRYYCKRSDGTTGLIVGGAAGGVLGNIIDGGRHRTAGTLIGGALGALIGKSVEQNQQQIRCR